jgi:hypothetical protein
MIDFKQAIALADDRFQTGDRTCDDRVKIGDRTCDDRVKVGDRIWC